MPKLGPRQPKNVGNSGKNISFQRVALGPQNWLGLGLTWARPAPKGAKLGRPKLGPKRCRWTPRRSKVMHIEVQVTSTVVQLGTLSNEASLIAKKVKNTSENGYFEDFRLGRLVVHFEAYGPQLGPNLFLAPSWSQVGPKLGQVCPSWGLVGLLRPCRIETMHLDDVVHVQFLAACPERTWPQPKAEAVPVNRGLFESIGPAPKLSRLGTFGRAELWFPHCSPRRYLSNMIQSISIFQDAFRFFVLMCTYCSNL